MRILRATNKDPDDYLHPADMWMEQLKHEQEMRRIRELDIEEWARENLDIRGPLSVEELDQ